MIFDTHCHIYDDKYEEGIDKVVETCLMNGISLMMIPGDNINNSKKAIDIASRFEEVYCAIGIHPEEVDSIDLDEGIKQLKELYLTSNKIKAIGINICNQVIISLINFKTFNKSLYCGSLHVIKNSNISVSPPSYLYHNFIFIYCKCQVF